MALALLRPHCHDGPDDLGPGNHVEGSGYCKNVLERSASALYLFVVIMMM